MLSQFSIQIMSFYILTRVYSLTQSTVAVSIMWMAGALPALFFGPFSGAIVDNFSRRKLMIGTNILQAVVIFMILFVDQKVFLLYVIVFAYWLLDQLYYPSQQASAPNLVDKVHLPMVNGLFLLTQQASIIVGFGLGGILLSTIGRTPTIAIASLNLIIASLACYSLPRDEPKKNLFEKDLDLFWRDFKLGYKFIQSHRAILVPLLTIIAAQVFISVISTVLPTYTQEVLGLDLNQAGITLIVPGAIGALCMTYWLPQFTKKFRKKFIVESGLLWSGISLILLSFLRYLPYGKPLIALFAAMVLGISITAVTVPAQSVLQEKTPSWLQGRVYGQMGFLLILATSLPLIASAAIADLLGVATLLGLFGLSLVVGFAWARRRGDLLLQGKISYKFKDL